MPDIARFPHRFDCKGINYAAPLDAIPEDYFPYLLNARIVDEGRIDGRPGYTNFIGPLADTPNSIRRLNDPDRSFASAGYEYVVGAGGNLYAGTESAMAVKDSGYSGHPLSLIPFRPEGSAESYMYVYDQNKNSKVRPDGTVKSVGLKPPAEIPLVSNGAPIIDYGTPAMVDVDTGQGAGAFSWVPAGGATGTATVARSDGGVTIANILYNSGSTGWCCINPTVYPDIWAGNRMKVTIGGTEQCLVREVHPPIAATTVAAFRHTSPVLGAPTSIVLTGSPTGLARNSLIKIASEVVRVLAVVPSPTNPSDYSIECVTFGDYAPGTAVTGVESWYVYTTATHAAGESLAMNCIAVNSSAAGTSQANKTVTLDCSKANGRLVDLANDWMHISFSLPTNFVTDAKLMITFDSPPTFNFSPGPLSNCIIWDLTPATIGGVASGTNVWVEVLVPLSSGVRHGPNTNLTLANITGLSIQVTTSGTGGGWGFSFDWWYIFGTYGPVIQPNAPTGYTYTYRYRDSATNAHSVPGPNTAYQVFPLREAVTVTMQASSEGADTQDIYRFGGTIPPPPLLVGSTTALTFLDTLSDSSVLGINQPVDLTALKPWTTLDSPWTGTVNVTGTLITWVSGHTFNTNLIAGTAITINGVTYQTSGQPLSNTLLRITQDGGAQTNVPFTVSSPELAGVALPFAFGALEGPFAPTIFALGDPVNGGTLYFSNFSDADSASDQNSLELSTPSAELISGAVWNGLAFAGSRDELFVVRFSYLTTIGASTSNSFQWAQIPAPSGIWSRWACCTTPLGVAYLGRDGLYLATDNGSKMISDALYPLFPHEGQPAQLFNVDGYPVYPVDMTQYDFLRLSYCDNRLRFTYIDTNGAYHTLTCELHRALRWLPWDYANHISYHYLVEADAAIPTDMEILALSLDTKTIVKEGGGTDAGAAITTILITPSDNGKDSRMQKLYVDQMVHAQGTGSIKGQPHFNQGTVVLAGSTQTLPGTPAVVQLLYDIDNLGNLALYRNVGIILTWTGGPDGPKVLGYETSGFTQPYLTDFFVTQYTPLDFPGWKHIRRMFPALISTAPVLMTIATQDGRSYGPYTIPSTGGKYRILPMMADHGVKDLAMAFQLDGQGHQFAFFPQDFTMEMKEWNEQSYIKLAVFRA